MANESRMIEVTEAQIYNAMLMPGEYVERDGKFYARLGLMEGYATDPTLPASVGIADLFVKEYLKSHKELAPFVEEEVRRLEAEENCDKEE